MQVGDQWVRLPTPAPEPGILLRLPLLRACNESIVEYDVALATPVTELSHATTSDSAAWSESGVLVYDSLTLIRHGPEAAPTSVDLYVHNVYKGTMGLTWNDTILASVKLTTPEGYWARDDPNANITATSFADDCEQTDEPADPDDPNDPPIEEDDPDDPVECDGGGDNLMSASMTMEGDDCEEEEGDTWLAWGHTFGAAIIMDGLSSRQVVKRISKQVAKKMLPGAQLLFAFEVVKAAVHTGIWAYCEVHAN